MTTQFPALRAQEVIRALEKVGFQVVRQKGSHVGMSHGDGRVVTVPTHLAKTLDGVFCARSYGMRNSPVRRSWNCFEAMVAMLSRGAGERR